MIDAKVKVAVIVGATIVGGVGGYIWQRYVDGKVKTESDVYHKPEMVYSYDEAVERARAKLQETGEDGVRAIGPMPKPLVHQDMSTNDTKSALPWNEDQSSIVIDELKVTEADMVSYHELSGEYDTVTEDPRPELSQEDDAYRESYLPDVKPWPSDKTGKWAEISEHKYKHEEPWFDKLTATYFSLDRVLTGWDGELTPLSEEELLRRSYTLATGDVESLYFRDVDNERDVEVIICTDKYEDDKSKHE